MSWRMSSNHRRLDHIFRTSVLSLQQHAMSRIRHPLAVVGHTLFDSGIFDLALRFATLVLTLSVLFGSLQLLLKGCQLALDMRFDLRAGLMLDDTLVEVGSTPV